MYMMTWEFIPNPTYPWWPKLGVGWFKVSGDVKDAGEDGEETKETGEEEGTEGQA